MPVRKSILILLPVMASAVFAQNSTPQNPLDGLTPDEYWVAYDVLQAAGHLPDKTHFASIQLHEPPKQEVLAWMPGKPLSRKADVALVREGHSFAALVDVSGHKLESWKELQGGFAASYQGEFGELGEAVKQ